MANAELSRRTRLYRRLAAGFVLVCAGLALVPTSAWHAAIQFLWAADSPPIVSRAWDHDRPSSDPSEQDPAIGPIPVTVGEPWPDVTLVDMGGTPVRLAAGVPLVVEFGSAT